MSCHFLLQRIFPTQGSNLCLLHSGRFFTTEPPGKPQGKDLTRKKEEQRQVSEFSSLPWSHALSHGIILFRRLCALLQAWDLYSALPICYFSLLQCTVLEDDDHELLHLSLSSYLMLSLAHVIVLHRYLGRMNEWFLEMLQYGIQTAGILDYFPIIKRLLVKDALNDISIMSGITEK